MTITFQTTDIAADEVADVYGSSAVAAAVYPPTPIAGHLAILSAASRTEVPTYNAPSNGPWTAITDLTGGDTTAHAAGAVTTDLGRSRAGMWSRVLSGSETGSSSVQATTSVTNNCQVCNLTTWSTDAAGGFAPIIFVTGSDGSHGTSRSVTFGAWGSALAVGDVVVILSSIDTDNAGVFSSPTFTQTGTTFGTVTRRARGLNGTGADNGLYLYSAAVTAGGSTNALTFSLTSATNPQSCGPSIAIRLREASGATQVTKQVDISYDVAAKAIKQTDVSYDIAAKARKQVDVSYDVAAKVSKQVDVSYDIAAKAVKQTDVSYDVVGRVRKQVDISYDIAAKVSKATDVSYDVRAEVSRATDISYDVAGKAVKQTDVSYDVAAKTSKATDITYDVAAKISSRTDILYDVAAKVSKATDVSYDIAGRVSKPVDISYDVAGRAIKQTDIIWDVEGLLSVSASWNILYDVGGRVRKQTDISWDVFAIAEKAVDISWDVYSRVQKQTDISYNVLGRVSKPVDISYDVGGRVRASWDISWDVQGGREKLPVSVALPGSFIGSASLGTKTGSSSLGDVTG